MNKRFFFHLEIFVVMLSVVVSTFIIGQVEEHVYYGYAPPSTDIGFIQEVIDNKEFTYSVPSGTGLLDVIGLQDNTQVSLYDLTSGILLNSTTINKLQKITFFIRYGTYFKLVSSHRVVAMISGGRSAYERGSTQGYSTYYPSVDGGFRGKSFIFMPATSTHDPLAIPLSHYNFIAFALEDTEFNLSDATRKFSTTESLKQRDIQRIMLQTRVAKEINLTEIGGGGAVAVGYDERFILNSTGDMIVASTASDQVLYVPAITGGYVGKIFWAPDKAQLPETGRSVVLVVTPLEPGKVTVYDKDLNVLAEHTFTSADVSANSYWFKSFGLGIFDFIIKSTGDITVLASQTNINVSEDFIGSGITFLGARPNQELKFFTPSSAIIFSSQDQTVIVDGQKRSVKKDEVILLGSGVHSIKGTGVLTIEVLAPGVGSFQKWGSYLIEPIDILKSYENIESLATPSPPYLTYAGVAVGLLIVIGLLYIFMLKRKKKL
ncbi:MAG: hypothetical protein HA495_08870 [Thaumarchaeota archaeon]|nr:hypothetical protein [Nitrososphaerota archaeon]